MQNFVYLHTYFILKIIKTPTCFDPREINRPLIMISQGSKHVGVLTLNLPTTTIVAQPFNVIKWQLKFNPVA